MTTVTDAFDDSRKPPTSPLRRLLHCGALLLAVFVVCFFFAEDVFQFLAQPIADAMIASNVAGNHQRMVFTALTEVFFTYMKVAFFAAAFICFPVFVTQVLRVWIAWRGRTERSGTLVTLAVLAIPFVLGGAVAYYVVFPRELAFWLAFQVPAAEGTLPIELEPKVGEYLSLLMRRIFTFGLVFLLPAALFLFFRAGRVEEKAD
jgi:sec-independent protein translocase protein TatC